MKFTLLFFWMVAVLWIHGPQSRGDDAPKVDAGREVEVIVSPGVKVKVRVPEGWAVRLSHAAADASIPVVVVTYADNYLATSLTFSTDAGGKLGTQEEVGDFVRQEDATFAKGSKENHVNVVEFKSPLGFGAYAVFHYQSFFTAGHFYYSSLGLGRFVTKGVVVRFSLNGDDMVQQVVKFIGNGITVE